MGDKIEPLYHGDPRIERMMRAIIDKIDQELPDDTLIVSVLGMLDFVKNHYIQRAYQAEEE